MPSSPRRLRVVLVSPGDVRKERDLVPGAIEQINRGTARALGVELVLLRWETDAYPGFHPGGGQGIVDRVLKIEDYDLLLGLFWTRFGGETTSGEGRTEHEIRTALKSKAHVMLYFGEKKVPPSQLDRDQYARIEAFRQEMESQGLYWTYRSPAEFERLLRAHLDNWLHDTQTPVAGDVSGPRVAAHSSAGILPLGGGQGGGRERNDGGDGAAHDENETPSTPPHPPGGRLQRKSDAADRRPPRWTLLSKGRESLSPSADPPPQRQGTPENETPSNAILHGLPRRNPLFTGREDELKAIHEALKTGDAALTSGGIAALQGLGGEGKTQTAVEYAYRHAGEYERVFFVRAEKPGEFESMMAGLAEELDLPISQDQAAQYRAVHAWFEGRGGWLLIVDNAEELSERGKGLPRHPEGRVLVTTRERVRARLGWSRVEIAHLDDATGALLLLRCAGRIGLGGTLGDAPEKERDEATTLSQELGGLALALDQAGAYMDHSSLGPAAYLDLYRKHRTPLLDQGEGEDHRTVTVTFALALAQVEAIPEVGPAAARLIRLCAFLAPDAIPDETFRNAFHEIVIDPPLQGFVADDLAWNRVVEAATRFSLLKREADPPGLSLHRLVAEVIRDAMDEAERKAGIERAAAALNAAFPPRLPDYADWPFYERLLPHALALRERFGEFGVATKPAANLLNQAALYLQQRGRYREAVELRREVVSMDRTLYEGDHREVAVGLANLGTLLTLMGKYGEATRLLEEATAMDARMPDADDLDVAIHLDLLADAYYRQKLYSEAVGLWRRALALTEGRLGPDHLSVSIRLNNLTNGLVDLGEYAEAEGLARRGLEIKRKTIGESHPEYATSLMNLGGLYVRWGRLDAAEAPLRRSLELRDAIHGGAHPDCAHSRFQLAAWHFRKGDRPAARVLLQEALAIRERLLGPDHPDTLITREALRKIDQ